MLFSNKNYVVAVVIAFSLLYVFANLRNIFLQVFKNYFGKISATSIFSEQYYSNYVIETQYLFLFVNKRKALIFQYQRTAVKGNGRFIT